MSATLTKKQQKLQAFRNKQKGKKAGVEAPPDLPEEDPVEDEVDAVVLPKSKSTEKRKRDDEAEDGGEGETKVEEKKDKGKKKKTAWDDEEEGDEPKKKSKKDIKQRFILFVGNLSFKTTKEEVQTHFKEAVGNIPAVRLLTTKPTPAAPVPKSRGIAFLELPTSTAMQAALKLHHSNLKGRTINVELTAGGGGGSEDRKRKIDERNKRVGTQRERKAEREKEEGADQEAEEGGAGAQEETGTQGKTKVRGGRRVKSKTKSTDESAPAAKRPRSDDPNAAAPGWNRQPSAASRPPRGGAGGGYGGRSGGDQRDKFQRKKWQPTGANAVSVG